MEREWVEMQPPPITLSFHQAPPSFLETGRAATTPHLQTMKTVSAQRDSVTIAIRPKSGRIPHFPGPRPNSPLENCAALLISTAVFS